MNRAFNNYFETHFAVMYNIRLALLFLFNLTFLTSFAQKDSVTISEEYFQQGMEIFDFAHRKQATDLS